MLNDAQVSLTGYVATQPVIRTVQPTGATNLSMRVAWTPRRQDRVTGEWVDGNTSYVTVICWRKLATNVAICVRKGDPVLVKGRLSVRPYDDKEGVPRLAVEVDASSVGHDLSRGVASFQRVRPQTGMTATEYAAFVEAGGQVNGTAPYGRSGAGSGYAGSGSGSPDGAGLDGAGQDSTGLGGVRLDGVPLDSAVLDGAGLDGAGADTAEGWSSGGDADIPLPDEPQDAFLDEAAIADVVGAATEGEPAGATS